MGFRPRTPVFRGTLSVRLLYTVNPAAEEKGHRHFFEGVERFVFVVPFGASADVRRPMVNNPGILAETETVVRVFGCDDLYRPGVCFVHAQRQWTVSQPKKSWRLGVA